MSFLFAACAAVADFDPGNYSYRVSMTASGYSGEERLEKFPVLVRLSPQTVNGFDYEMVKTADGSDIAFTDSTGNVIPHEIDTWNTSGESLIWVRLPSLSGTETTFTMHFGSTTTTAGGDSSDVWTNKYAAVWHLNRDAKDSTGHNLGYTTYTASEISFRSNDILGMGSHSETSGDSGGTKRIVFDNPANFMAQMSDQDVSSHALTVSAWIKLDSTSIDQVRRLICWKQNYGDSTGFEIFKRSGSLALRGSQGSGGFDNINWNWSSDWTHLVAVFNGTKAWCYMNGTLISNNNSATGTVAAVKKATVGVGLGGMGGGSSQAYACRGDYDELRFYDGVASADWAKAEYDTVVDRQFLSYGEVSDYFNGDPVVTLSAEDGWVWSCSLADSSGDVFAVLVDEGSGAATTNLVRAAAVGPTNILWQISGLAADTAYSFGVYLETDVLNVYRPGLGTFYNGVVSLSASGTADEATKSAATVTIARSGAMTYPLDVPIVATGTAVAGQSYAALPAVVTIPAGAASATVAITPLEDGLTDEDVVATVAVADGWCLPGDDPALSVSVTILNDPGIVVDPTVRYISPDGDDSRAGTSLSSAMATLGAALASLGANGGTVNVADGTYTDASTLDTLYDITAPVVVQSISSNASKVVFRKGSQSARIFRLTNADAVLRNISICDGGFVGAYGNGGNIYLQDGLVEGCVVSGGSSGTVDPGNYETGGGNIYMTGGRVSRSIITNAVSSITRHYGTAIYMTGGVVENSLIAYNRNDATDGGVIRMASQSKMYNCTVVMNASAEMNSPAFFFGQNQNKPRVYNTAIWSNVVESTGASSVAWRLTGNFVSCAADAEIPEGTDCLLATTFGFKAPEAGDFSLTSSSILVDTGRSDASPQGYLYDLSGNTRFSGQAIDIGAYEYDVNDGFANVTPSTEVAVLHGGTASVDFSVIVTGVEGAYQFAWDFGDGETATGDSASVSHVYETPGLYHASVSVIVGGETILTGRTSRPVKVCPETVYVNLEGSDEMPYDTRERGAVDLQTVLDYAVDGMTIIVCSGTYVRDTSTKPGRYVIDKAITVKGATGRPEDVVFSIRPSENTGFDRNINILNPSAVVSSITFEGGRQYGVGGGAVYMEAGVLTNCVVRKCHLANGGENGYILGGGIWMKGGLVTHTKVLGAGAVSTISQGFNGVNGIAIAMSGGVCRDCLFSGDYDAPSGREEGAYRCAGNFVYVDDKGRIENCTIAGRALRYDCTRNENDEETHDKALYVGTNARAVNCVVAGMTYYCVDPEKTVPLGATPVLINVEGTRGGFVNCAFDTLAASDLPSTTCVSASAADMFRDFANGDYRPKSGGSLCNAGASYEGVSSLDLAGKLRLVGSAVDIGCYEAQMAGLSVLVR